MNDPSTGGPPLPTEEVDENLRGVTDLTPIQKAGVVMLSWVGSIGAAFIWLIFVLSFFWPNKPTVPITPLAPTDNSKEQINRYKVAVDQYQRLVGQYKLSVDIYQSVNKAQEERAKNLFQSFIVTALLPTFTSILGYIFGSRSKD